MPKTKPEVTSEPATKTPTPILKFSGVNKFFRVGKDNVQVLKDVNLEIFPQEFVLIFGPSGSGKSTLLNHLLGLEQPTSGNVYVNGREIGKLDPNTAAKLRFKYFGVVFQRPDWINSINVLQNVSVPLALHNVGRRERLLKAKQYLTQLGIDNHAAYNPNDLSGGEQQKVAIARALINDPDIIIADEPTGNLDTDSAKKVMDIFQDLHQTHKKTIIMVTHNFEYLHYGSRLLSLRDGQVSTAGASTNTVF